jgi:hypothetical protein
MKTVKDDVESDRYSDVEMHLFSEIIISIYWQVCDDFKSEILQDTFSVIWGDLHGFS